MPAPVVQRSLDGLRKDGKVRYAYLGVQSVELYPQLVDRFDLPVGKGAWVQVVQPDGPGAKAGLKGGKRGRALPGADVHRRRRHHHQDRRPQDRHARRPSEAVQLFDPGQKVKVEVYRDGKKRDLDLMLGERPLNPPRNSDG